MCFTHLVRPKHDCMCLTDPVRPKPYLCLTNPVRPKPYCVLHILSDPSYTCVLHILSDLSHTCVCLTHPVRPKPYLCVSYTSCPTQAMCRRDKIQALSPHGWVKVTWKAWRPPRVFSGVRFCADYNSPSEETIDRGSPSVYACTNITYAR